ncbi:YqiA/YcfP family alpha/beta fold hydrolase [Maridesulfovibrio sp.]|uniref:YqiA/YcfP family alpha/beta fold hydrolase n=1 Tax=Maridesulfovibrio sp. TaxID=2795000 RepID=UPI002A188E57|nr:YqiA/YcfP family alpha/beta fold hydrolase [Maridesulfovibrio sp.]
MKNIFLNIHGFGSSGSNSKAAALAQVFPDYNIISPDLPPDPQESLAIIEDNVLENCDKPLVLQGSSMGGLYSLVMHMRHGVPALLINPALAPGDLIAAKVGEPYEFSNGDSIIVSEEHAERFFTVQREVEDGVMAGMVDGRQILALIGEQDELLDQNRMKDILRRAGAGIISYDTDHRFSIFEEVLGSDGRVRDFLVGAH